jgi:hypothetical protein
MPDPIVIKKSPIIIIKNLIILEFAATLAYFISGILGNYTALYQGFTISTTISYELAKFFFIGLAQILLITFIFLKWLYGNYIIYPDKVIKENGVIFKKRTISIIKPPLSVSFSYVPLSKIFKYGSISITGIDGKTVILDHVPTPKTYLRLIKEQLANDNGAYHDEIETNIVELIKAREHERLEFKTTFRWDMEAKQINKNIEKAALKTIAAFLNSQGGHLIIGIDDKGVIIGLEYDYKTIKKKDADGFENHFTNVFKEIIGAEFREFVKLNFHNIENKEICAVRVEPSRLPVYAKTENDDVFYIRTGNSTTALQLREVTPYIKSRFREYARS